MEKWLVSTKKADFDEWAQEFGISPVLARIIRNRDIIDKKEVQKYLNGGLKDCYSPWLLHDMDRAADFVLQKIRKGTSIRVIGDYDVDGICSSYILTKGLSLIGGKVDTAIPHRIHDGYGLNEHLIELAKEEGIEMIITCDNGIAAAPQVALAKDYGMTVIITDHHEVPYIEEDGKKKEILPVADAVIDPKKQECSYPCPGICGGVVAYKLIQALSEKTKDQLLLSHMGELLQFAAIATVCDVMELRDENRLIVKEGLKLLRKTKNQGLLALMEVNGIDPQKLSAYHLGFVIGPCLNATGRLDTAYRALELLQSQTKADAMSAAAELKSLNDSRKNLTQKGVEEALQYVLQKDLLRNRVLVIYLPDVHESLAGIIAGRIREQFYRPVFILTKGEGNIKGSGRSIETYHMYDNMTKVKHCFSKYGGHKLAAGLSLAPRYEKAEADIEAFSRELNEICTLTEEDLIPRIHIDVPMPIGYADMSLARELEKLEPFGVGNPKPLFAQKNLIFLKGYKMGVRKSFAKYRIRTQEGIEAELVYFGSLEQFHEFLEERFGYGSSVMLYEAHVEYPVSVTYQLSINSYRGADSLQFIMQNYC